ncbi:hypothetical protein CPB86DRAFT_808513 [Serendipita vermifera]|nr:hypothetical protein CPB86DRAFT_808513 [Serendipita vermifera]
MIFKFLTNVHTWHEHRGSHLRINVPPTLTQQAGGQPLFSPALPTVLQHQFRPSISHGLPHPLALTTNNPNLVNALQTPVQTAFFPPPQGGFIPGHQQRGSIVGPINIAPGFPIPPQTPLGGPGGLNAHQIPPHLAGMAQMAAVAAVAAQQQASASSGAPGGHGGHGRAGSVSLPFNRNRRQGSVSLGGPPKATLGGPQNKHVAAPMTNPASSAAAIEKVLKGKKINVKIPKESSDEDGVAPPEFARRPIPVSELPAFDEPRPLDTNTAIMYPEERPRGDLPRTVEVFLPGKGAWDTLKRSVMEEKLLKLGVERNGVPPILAHHGPHGRAASISSPADPNLLMFKLNKLHQHQAQLSPSLTAGSGRLSVSPGPHTKSPSPNHLLGPRFNPPGGNHRHSMSLANPTYVPPTYNPSGAFNPFGPAAVLGSDQIISPSLSTGSGRGRMLPEEQPAEASSQQLHAPRGIPGHLSSALGRQDFIRGFGLDITEETEEELELEEAENASQAAVSEFGASEVAAVLQEELDAIPELDETPSKPGSRRHSRHASRVSAALSLRSLGRGGKSDSGIAEEEETPDGIVEAARAWESEGGLRDGDDDATNEWSASDDESIGEYSNPSDEERARELKRQRLRAKVRQRLPNMSQNNGLLAIPQTRRREQDSDDIVSNPSEEERAYKRNSTGSRPLPAIPTSASHSRAGSGQLQPHFVPLPHSRNASGQYATVGSNHVTPPIASPDYGTSGPSSGFAIKHRDSLNPHAQPFVFGKPWYSSTTTATTATAPTINAPPTNAPAPSAARLNVAAAEFKPSVAAAPFVPSVAAKEFKPSVAAPEFKPSLAAPEFKPSLAAPEFKPTLTAPEFKPTLPMFQFSPRPLLGAFKSNPGSGDFQALVDAERAAPSLFSVLDSVAKESVEAKPEPAKEEASVKATEPAPITDKLEVPESQVLVTSHEITTEPTPLGADSLTWSNLISFQFPPNEEEEAVQSSLQISTSMPVSATEDKVESFVFPPKKKSVTAPVDAPVVPSIVTKVTSPPPALTAETQLAIDAKTRSGIMRSPKPPPLTELPGRHVDLDERPNSSSASSAARALPQPPQRAQTLLDDFKSHPVSANTVPASFFRKKASASNPSDNHHNAGSDGDDDGVPLALLRPRLGSRDLLEHSHRPSLDDIHMPTIARKSVKVPETEIKVKSPVDKVPVTPEIITINRRSSLPMPRSAPASSLGSDVDSPLKKRFVVEPKRVDNLIEEKMETLRLDIRNLVEQHLVKLNTPTSTRSEEALMRIARLMREHADERQGKEHLAAERLKVVSSLDPELVRNIVEDSNKEVCASVQRDLSDFARRIQSTTQNHPGVDVHRSVEEQASRIITALSSSTMNLATRLEALHALVERPVAQPVHHRVPSHEELLKVLRPHLEQLRSSSFDVDTVTARLAEAVKPTLADFIDLASDKGETADLIVSKLAPVLASVRPPQFDTQAVAAQLAANVNRFIPPVDSHALTEQVADLVVERLDSRLTVRDKALRPEILAQKVTEAITPLVANDHMETLLLRVAQQDGQFETQKAQIQALEAAILRDIGTTTDKILHHLSGVTPKVPSYSDASSARAPQTVNFDPILSELQRLAKTNSSQALLDEMDGLRQEIRSQFETLMDTPPDPQDGIAASQATLVEVAQQTQNLLDSGLSDLLHAQQQSSTQMQDMQANYAALHKQIAALPEHLAVASQAANHAQSELLSKLRVLPEINDLQNQRMELQVQLNKARSSYGQVRSEKEVLSERLQNIESERNRLREELQSLKNTLSEKESDVSLAATKADQTNNALQHALARVESSEAITKALREQILRMESTHRDLQKTNNERQIKVDSLELQLSFATRDKEVAQETLDRVEQERDAAIAQQQETLRESSLASQKMDSLLQMLTKKESDELVELRKYRDRSKEMESELSNTRKRAQELEARIEQLIRNEAKTAQSLEHSRLEVKQSEVKIGSLEREIEPLRRLNEAQKTRDQDFEEIRLQLQNQEKQENLLRQTNNELEAELAAVRADLELSQKAQATARWQQHQTKEPTTNVPAYARAAPTTNGRSVVSGAGSSRSNTPPATVNGVWSSMHAPSKSGKVPPGYQSVPRSAVGYKGQSSQHIPTGFRRAVSPAQSVVSQAPTLREDGWWE